MKCEQCKFFEFKHASKWLVVGGEFKWGICHKKPSQPSTYRDSWCAMFEPSVKEK